MFAADHTPDCSPAAESATLSTLILRASASGAWVDLYAIDPLASPNGRHAQACRCLVRALGATHLRFHGEPAALGRLAAALSGQVVSLMQGPTFDVPANLRPWRQVLTHLRRLEVGSVLPSWQTCDAIASLHDHLAGRGSKVVDLFAKHQMSDAVIAGLLASAGVSRA